MSESYKLKDITDETIPNFVLRRFRNALGISSDSCGISSFDGELTTLIYAADCDLKLAGIKSDLGKPLYYQAIIYYLKANFRNNEHSEKYLQAYEHVKAAMSLSDEYRDNGGSDSNG